MAITLDELRAALQAAQGGGDFRLPLANLRSAAVDDLAARFFPRGELYLTGATSSDDPADGGTVVARGAGVETPLTATAVEARFLVVGGEAVLRLTATAAAGWTLGAAFPPLEGTMVSDLAFATATPPVLRLRSDPEAPETAARVQLDAVLDLDATTGGLAALLNRPEQAVSGVIDADHQGASVVEVDLSVPVTVDVSLGVVTLTGLTFTVGGELLPGLTPGTVMVAPRLEVSANLALEAQGKTYPLLLAAEVHDLGAEWRFRVGVNGLIDAAWDELSHLAGGVELTDFLPAGLDLAALLTFDDLVFDVDFTAASPLQMVALGVRSAEPWTVARLGGSDQNLVVERVELTVVVREPLGRKAVAVHFGGTVAVGSAGALAIDARYPDPDVKAYLPEGTTLHVDEVVGYVAGGGLSVPPIDVTELDLEVSSGAYRVAFDAEGVWPIGSLPLELDEVRFSVDHAAGDTAVTAGAVLGLAGVELAIGVEHSGAGQGWRFTGGTTAGQTIPICTLIGELVRLFGVDDALPEVVRSAVISELRVAFDTGASLFTFFCDTQLMLGSGTTPGADGKTLDATLAIGVKPGGGGYEKTVAGTVKVGELEFDLTFDADPTATRFLAGYEDASGGTVNLGTLLAAVTDDPAVTDAAGSFSLSLKDALLVYDRTAGTPAGDGGGGAGAGDGANGGGQASAAVSRVVFGADIGAGVDLSGLPLVGHLFSAGSELTLAFQPLVATAAVPAAEVEVLRGLIPPGGLPLPSGDLAKGLTLATRLQMGGAPVELKLPFGIDQGTGAITDQSKAAPTGPGNPPAAAPAASDGVHWVALQKAFGPVQLERVGVRFADGTLGFLLDGALSAAGLTLALDGLEADVKLADIQAHRFSPSFRLRGVGVDYSNGAVEIGGALLHLTPDETGGADEYDGMAVLKAAGFSLSAIGSYAELAGFRSLFLYAALNTPLGGPPYFFVTGLAAGFGFNRDLKIPAMDGLLDFPLIATAMQGAGADPAPTSMGTAGRGYLLDKLTKLHDYVPVLQGQYFFAVGLRVSTFKVLDTFALLTVSVGTRGAEFDLLGVMSLVLPPGAEDEGVTPLAELQLALRAAVVPDEGWAGLFGELTKNSYILSRSAKLTGGFAIVTWFAGEHAGDFVVTVGGYHPDFRVPSHYPAVPRLGLNWQVSTALTVKGGLYFALVPHAAMAGGDLEALFAVDSIKAWFRAGAHFLVSWKPFHYEASLYVDMGVSYTFSLFGTHTISVDLGADLKLWGPEFSGVAHVHLYVVSFTIEFGAGAAAPPPLDWATFRTSFLPADQNGQQTVLGVSTQAGLIRKAEDQTGPLDVVNPKEVVLVTNSLIPATRGATDQDVYAPIGIGPMAVAVGAVTSLHTVSVRFNGEPGTDLFRLVPVVKKAPRALWGGTVRPDLNAQGWVEGAVAGYEVRPAKLPAPGETHAVPRANLAFDTELAPTAVPTVEARTFTAAPDPAQWRARLAAGVDTAATAQARAAMLTALGFDPVAAVAGLDTPFADDFLFAPQPGVLARAA